MLVDDHEEFRTALREFLNTQESVRVVEEATDGIDAVRRAGYCRPDLILMDISMPRMDGFTATKEIRALYPKTAVAFVSFYDNDQYREMAMRLGAEGFLSKDKLSKELLALLDVMRERIKAESGVDPGDPSRSSMMEGQSVRKR